MVSALACAVVLAPVAPPFDASLKAHSNIRMKSVVVTAKTKTPRVNRTLNGTFQIQGFSRAKLAVTRSGKPYRWYVMEGSLLSGYDSANDEYLTQRVTGKQSLLEKFLSAVPDADESLRTVLDPAIMAKLYSRLKTVKGWQVKNKTTYYFLGPKTRFVIEFDPATKLLKRFELVGNGSDMRWHYKWGPAGRIDKLAIPITAIKVHAFSDPKPPAVYMSESARVVARSSVRAYANLSSANMEIRSADTTLLAIRRGRALVKAPSYEWRYDGKNVLILLPRAKKAFAGPSTLLGLQEAFAQAGCQPDAYAFQVVARKNPMRRLLFGGVRVKHIGSVSLDGQPCDLLEISNPEILITAAIRKKDGLIASETATYLTSGRNSRGSERRIIYRSQNVLESGFSTKPPAGYKVQKLN